MPRVVVPEYLLCPISLQLMTNPVMTADGQVYDHDEIKKWLETNNTSPLTNKPLSNKNLLPATIIKNVIEDFSKTLCSKEKFTTLISEKKMKELMECKYLDPYLKDCDVLSQVMDSEDEDILEWILNEGADVNGITNQQTKETLLFAAVRQSSPHLCKVLISRGASIDALNNSGHSPATVAPNLGILQLLVDAGCNVDIVVDGYPLPSWKTEDLEQLQWLHNKLGMDVKALAKNGCSLMHDAAGYGAVDSMIYLVECGLSAHATNKNLETPLHWAVCRAEDDDTEAVEFLLKNGAYVDPKDHLGITPLLDAIKYDKPKRAQLLLDHGADMFAENNKKKSPFSHAFKHEVHLPMLIQHHRKLLAERQQYTAQEAQRQQESQRQQTSDVQQALEFMKKTLLEVKDDIAEMKESTPKKRKKS